MFNFVLFLCRSIRREPRDVPSNFSPSERSSVHCNYSKTFSSLYYEAVTRLSFQQTKLILTETRTHVNPEFAAINLTLFKLPGNDNLLNFTLETFVEIIRYTGTFTVSVPKNAKDTDYEKQLLKSSVNMCNIDRGVRGNFIVKMLMENFANSSDFTFECPVQPRSFHLWNFRISDFYMPSYLMPDDLKLMIDIRVTAKVPKHKQFVYLYLLKFYGEVLKT